MWKDNCFYDLFYEAIIINAKGRVVSMLECLEREDLERIWHETCMT